MVHWKRDLDLYTIGRPLERNAGFWLDYMKGLKGDTSEPLPRRPLRPRAMSLPRPAQEPPYDPFFDDPYFWDPLDGIGLPHSPAYDDLRDKIARARRRAYEHRQAPYFF